MDEKRLQKILWKFYDAFLSPRRQDYTIKEIEARVTDRLLDDCVLIIDDEHVIAEKAAPKDEMWAAYLKFSATMGTTALAREKFEADLARRFESKVLWKGVDQVDCWIGVALKSDLRRRKRRQGRP